MIMNRIEGQNAPGCLNSDVGYTGMDNTQQQQQLQPQSGDAALDQDGSNDEVP